MSMHYLGKIRRIVVGQNIKDGMSFHVGQEMRVAGISITITDIVHDVDAYDILGLSKYIIYCQRFGSSTIIPFKSTENMAVFLEYDISEDHETN